MIPQCSIWALLVTDLGLKHLRGLGELFRPSEGKKKCWKVKSLQPAFSWKTWSVTGACVEQREGWTASRHWQSERAAVKQKMYPHEARSQQDVSLSKVPCENLRWLLLHRDQSLLFSLFPLESGLRKKPQNPALSVSSLKRFRGRAVYIIKAPSSSQDRWIAGEVLGFIQFCFFLSLQPLYWLEGEKVERSPFFFGFQWNHKKGTFSSFYLSQNALKV